jgi:hypothetical protein
MSAVHHLWERTLIAVNCMCRNGPFEERLESAYNSGLSGLAASDAPPQLASDLEWVLRFCEKNHAALAQRKSLFIKEAEQATLREKLLRLLVKSTQMSAAGGS